jgi:hypothetical protein
MARKPNITVTKNKESGWDLKKGKEVVKNFSTQAEAAEKGKTLAKKEQTDLTVMGKNGQIRSKDSYGNESKKKDKEH